MGTSWSVIWSGPPDMVSEIEHAMVSELQRINALMSTWDAQSELSRFNTLASVEPVTLHPDTLAVIDTAISISHKTGGKYDVTLEPVIRLWGFGKDDRVESPSEPFVLAAVEKTGYWQLVRVADTIRKRRPEISVDLSSLAKGFAVDQLGIILERHGVQNYLAEIGGEVRARGVRYTGDVWQVGIEIGRAHV